MANNNRRGNRKARKIIKSIATYAAVIVTVGFFIFPLFWLIATSLKTRAQAFSTPPLFIWEPTFRNFIDIFLKRQTEIEAITGQELELATGAEIFFFNSFVVTSFSIALAIVIGVLAAYSFSRYKPLGTNTLMFFILSTRMLPGIVVAIPIYFFYRSIGLYNTYLGLILLYTMFNLPFAIWMMKSFFDDIPKDIEQAAFVDGSPPLRVFRKIALPQVAVGLGATIGFLIINVWNEFLFALLLTERTTRTVPVLIASTRGEVGINWGLIAAIETLYILPALVLIFLLQRYLLRGMTFGTVRGGQ
ncbi:multiple sugar ABC transporter permease [Candidatus Caldarchaeum subterraneum]|uniref:Multiple sugar ABC transporter permease n=1 Tax=Caldiarchaeum subterraneum TaxID=311458 RepID=E6N5R8_CALS0|nr:multiple sugar ABC transporter permease [Candidatus Caldarchaeum subterraneum]BAJ47693.1 multiple sugar ABC transporter permease [Candidatus Caldarchaeum subterraneum]BAJ50509.1 multiple sugar ABC transporter permease [Candidatus Caldarchaeum subterraneum]